MPMPDQWAPDFGAPNLALFRDLQRLFRTETGHVMLFPGSDTGAREAAITNTLNPHYPGDQWHAAIARMVTACRAYGLRAIDGPFGDFSDPEGDKDGARRAAALGCEGKWAIHPSQVALANEVFSPPQAEVTRARRIIEELRKAAAMGKGAASLDGRMIDAASERMAQNVLVLAEAIAAR